MAADILRRCTRHPSAGLARTPIATLLALVLALATGCASTPRMPAEFDIVNTTIVADAAEPALVIDGPAGKGSGAAAGAAVGSGTGFLIGGLACVGAGPLAPLCLGLVVPTGMAVGAVSGAVVGAVRSDSAENVLAKRALLTALLKAPAADHGLAARLQQQLRDTLAAATPPGNTTAPVAQPEWTLKIVLTELATVGTGPDAPYALQATARLDVLRASAAQPVFVKHYQASSAHRLTTAEWRADDAQPALDALNAMSARLVTQMAGDMPGPGLSAESGP
jgi:hypothetical protein